MREVINKILNFRQHLLRQKQLEEQRRRQMMLQGQIPIQDEEEAEEQLRTVCW